MRVLDLLVTPAEAVRVLTVLEPRATTALETTTWKLTAARLRHLEQYGIVPVVGGSGVRGLARTRLYNVGNVAMLRLWARLSAEGGPALARFALAYLGADIQRALAARRSVSVVVRGRRAELVPVRQTGTATIAIPLREVLDGVAEAIAVVREDQPEVWAGLDWLSPAEALATA